MLPIRVLACVASGVLLMQLVSAQAPDDKHPSLPDGPGKAALLKACGECHGPESAVAQLKTHDEWSKTLDDMAANGAHATDEEWTEILAYLDKHFSLVLVNTADAKQLAVALDVSEPEADAIVHYRAEHGRFAGIDDVKLVPGVDAAKIDAGKDRFVF